MTSFVWKFFTVLEFDESKTECSICNQVLSRGRVGKGFTTTNMLRHLKLKHDLSDDQDPPTILPNNRLQTLTTISNESQDISPTKTDQQPFSSMQVPQSTSMLNASINQGKTIHETVNSMANATMPVPNQINQTICKFLAVDLLPLSFVEGTGFKNLIATLSPSYMMPPAHVFAESILPNMYSALRKKFFGALDGNLSVTIDLLTMQNNREVLTIIAHSVKSANDTRGIPPINQNFPLACKLMPEQYSIADVRNSITTCFEESHGNNIFTILCGKRVRGAFNLDNRIILPCLASTLVEIVGGFLEKSNDIWESVFNIVKSFTDSITTINTEVKYENCHHQLRHDTIDQNGLILKNDKNWKDIYQNIKHMLRQRSSIECLSNRGLCTLISEHDWSLLACSAELLLPFDTAIWELQQNNVSISAIVPMINNLTSEIENMEMKNLTFQGLLYRLKPEIKNTLIIPGKERQQLCLHQYFKNHETYQHCVIATILDPRFKISVFAQDDRIVDTCRNTIVQKACEYLPVDTKTVISTATPRYSVLFRKPANTNEVGKNDIAVSLANHLCTPVIPGDHCPLKYWDKYKTHCSALYKLAMKYLACPPTSSSTQQVKVPIEKFSNTDSSFRYTEMMSLFHLYLNKV